MLKLLEQYIGTDGGTVELFLTNHSGDNFHVRYGLQVQHAATYDAARVDFDSCVEHLRNCNGLGS